MDPQSRETFDQEKEGRGWRTWVATNRWFLALLAALGLGWVTTELLLWRQIRAEKVYYNQHVLPEQMREQAQNQAFMRALNDRKAGRKTPLPKIEQPNPGPLDKWLTMRTEGEEPYRSIAFYLEMCLLGTVAVGPIVLQIQTSLAQRRWNAPERPADPEAGRPIAELIARGGCLTSQVANRGRSFVLPMVVGGAAVLVLAIIGVPGVPSVLPKGTISGIIGAAGGVVMFLGVLAAKKQYWSAREIQIDAGKSRVSFKNFRFVTSFVSSRRRAYEEMPFSDILGLKITASKGQTSAEVRTTRGRVTIPDIMKPFGETIAVLADAVELNRLDPEAYRAALAREPVVRIPWWGWLPVVIVGAMVAWWFWYAMHS